MAGVQTTIKFPAKKNVSSISKKEKENFRSPSKARGKSTLDSERSPLKLSSATNNCDVTTPTKRKSSGGTPSSSPPKQLKSYSSPSELIKNVNLETPETKKKTLQSRTPVKVALFPDSPDCGARKALHRGSVSTLPGREDKIEQLTKFLLQCLEDHKSRSVYISGQPGTGKTASISYVTELPEIAAGFKTVYINCTGLKSSGSIFSTIGKKLGVKTGSSKSEKAYQSAIVKHLSSSKKIHLIVLDEQDELVSKGQQVLYTLMEWVSLIPNGVVMIGIANCLDLIDRALPRLASSSIKPLLIHFSPYTAQQITDIILQRLQETDDSEELFAKGALHLLASKVATVSGDVRRALDITARILQEADGKISVESVLSTFKCIYSTSETLCQSEDGFPLQQKLLICAFMLLKKKSNKKDALIGKLHDVYKKICGKKNIASLDMSEFISLLELVEARGVFKLQGKTKTRMTKTEVKALQDVTSEQGPSYVAILVFQILGEMSLYSYWLSAFILVVLQWDEKEITSALKDKELLSSIVNDPSYL